MRCLQLLGPLHWSGCPEGSRQRNRGQTTIPYRVLAAALPINVSFPLPPSSALSPLSRIKPADRLDAEQVQPLGPVLDRAIDEEKKRLIQETLDDVSARTQGS
jgi:hypothetical protein